MQGYATVGGVRVAISEKRSSINKDVLDLLFNRRLSTGQVKSAKSFFKAAAKTPQTFNSFYIDSKVIAAYTSGLLPIRLPRLIPGCPRRARASTSGRGFLKAADHPQGIGAEDGTIVNWNQGLARGFGAADDEWGRNGSVARNDMLTYNLKRLRNGAGKWSPATVDLRHERGGHPGHPRDRHRAAAGAGAEGLDRAVGRRRSRC